MPWLMLSSPIKPEFRYLYDISQRKITHELHLPQIAGHSFIGSSDDGGGFLFTIHPDNLNIHATNPFTGTHLPLPSISSLPGMIGAFRNPTSSPSTFVDDVEHRILCKGYNMFDHKFKHTDKDQLVVDIEPFLFEPNIHGNKTSTSTNTSTSISTTSLLLQVDVNKEKSAFEEHTMKDYFNKMILSPSLDTVVLSYYNKDLLAFARTGTGASAGPAASSWNAIDYHLDDCLSDIIFHEGRLLAVNCFDNTLIIFDLDRPGGHFERRQLNGDPFQDKYCNGEGWSLVESADGRDLFLVCIERDFISRGHRSRIFKVLKLNKSSNKWEEVRSIGELAFFLGEYNRSFSVDARDFPPGLVKPNSIYFTENIRHHMKRADVINKDTGVFHLEDGSLDMYQLTDAATHDFLNFNFPQPIWFMPPPLICNTAPN